MIVTTVKLDRISSKKYCLNIQYLGVIKMGGKDTSYQVVYRGESLKQFKPGQCVFFQRERQYGGGYWLGKTHVDGFEFLLEQPTSLREGMLFLLTLAKVEARHMEFVDFDDFNLT
ncbi:Uncharacterised protein [Klebsiella variicola]|nr:Uncharacterised protein [Klebsiella variicola]